MEQVPPCRSDFAPWNRKLLSVMQLPFGCWREIVTDVGHKPGREKTARYIADNVLDPAPVKGATTQRVYTMVDGLFQSTPP